MVWYLFALGSAFFSTLSALVGKKSLLKVHAMQFSCILAILNSILSLPFILVADLNIPPAILFVMYITSVIGTVAFLFMSKAVRHLDISHVSPLMNINPGILAVLAYFILGERLTHSQLAGILFIMLGAYVIEIDWKKHGLLGPLKVMWRSRHIHYIFISSFLYALGSVGDKYILTHVSPFTYMLVIQFFIAVNFTLLITLFYGGFKDISGGYRVAGNWIFLMALFTLTYRLLQAWAVSLTLVSLVVPIKRLSTLFSTVAGGRLFHEKGIMKRILACIIMLFGAFLVISGL